MADQWLKQYKSKIKDARQMLLEDAPVTGKRGRRKPYKLIYRFKAKPDWWDKQISWLKGDDDWQAWRVFGYYARVRDAEQAFDAVRRWAKGDVECRVVER